MGGFLSTILLDHESVTLYTAEETEQLSIKLPKTEDNASPIAVDDIPLEEFVRSRCPSLVAGFRPVWWLPNGHFQTAYCVLGDFSKVDNVVYSRTLLRLRDGATLGLDFTSSDPDQSYADDTPVVVVLHGLTGGSHESYVRAILAPATAAISNGGLGFRGVVVNFRGCAGVPLTTGQLYSAGYTEDIRQALLYISQLYPAAPLLGVGFSLGANILTRYIAEEGDRCRLKAGCIIGCPWDLVKNSERLEDRWFFREVYSKSMGQNLVKMFARHLETISKLPGNRIADVLPQYHAMQKPTLVDFDDTITRLVGGPSPPFPFASAWDYYKWASSHKVLGNVRIPCLAINARDDPVVSRFPFDVGGSSYVVLAVTSRGGHLGWFERGEAGGLSRWSSKPIFEWLDATGNDLIQPTPERGAKVELDGFWTEEGLEHLGWKIISDGEEIIGVEGEGGILAGL